jgi:hypothetical protein
MRARIPRPFHEHLDGDILRARGIPNNARDDAGDAPILSLKDSLDIESGLAGLHLNRGVAQCVHDAITPAGGGL